MNVSNVCRYIAFLARSLSFSSIPGYLNIIRIMHLEAGLDNPLDNYHVRALLKGVKRAIGAPPKQKLPITPEVLLAIHSVLDFSVNFNVALWAAMLVAFFTFLRKSSLLPQSFKEFDCKKHLCYNSVNFVYEGALLSVKTTKTIQCRERELCIPLPVVKDSILCPVTALQNMFDRLVTVYPNMPLFSYSRNKNFVCLTYSSFVKALKQVLSACGYDYSKYSGHSFRRGGATFAFSCGIPSEYIKIHGDWKSSAYLRYIDVDTSMKWKLAYSMSDKLPRLS